MNLHEDISRIKQMMGIIKEDNSKKDLSPMIRESLNSLIERKKHIVCDIEVTAPWNRKSVEFDGKFQKYSSSVPFKHYKVLVTFIGGYGTKYFPLTQSDNQKYDDIMDEVWHTVYDYFGEPTDVYSKKVKECGNTIQEGLNDKWTRGEDTVTLKQLLKITKDIPVTKMSTKKLMKHALHGNNPEEMKKVDKTSLKYPVLVLVGDKGLIKYILDGHHRIQKANKHDVKMVNVKLIKFSELPKEFKKVLGGQKEEQTEGELTEKCWAGYTQKGMKTMFGKRYPNCVKKTKN